MVRWRKLAYSLATLICLSLIGGACNSGSSSPPPGVTGDVAPPAVDLGGAEEPSESEAPSQ